MRQCPLLYLHVFVFDLLAGGDAVGDVEVDELWRQVYSRGQPADINPLILWSARALNKKKNNRFSIDYRIRDRLTEKVIG